MRMPPAWRSVLAPVKLSMSVPISVLAPKFQRSRAVSDTPVACVSPDIMSVSWYRSSR
jgi:hypothetical protein